MMNGTNNSTQPKRVPIPMGDDHSDGRSMDAMLDQGLSNRLTLVVGSLDEETGAALAGWIERRSIPAVLIDRPDDEASNDCLRNVVDAFIGAGIIKPDALEVDSISNRVLLVRLINELAALDHDIALVIADYTPTEAADCVLTFLLEHLPQQLHLYLFCDTPPKLSCIPRLRVRRQLQMIDVKAS